MANKKIITIVAAAIVLLVIIMLSRCSCGTNKQASAEAVPAAAKTKADAAIAVEPEKTGHVSAGINPAAKAMEGIQIKTKKRAGGGEALEVIEGGKKVYSLETMAKENIKLNTDGTDENLPRAGTDVTGDGKADMVVQVSSAKDSCSNSYEILSVVDDFSTLAEIKGLADGVKFEDIDGDGKQEISGHDCTFMDWWASFGEVLAPQVILRYGEDGYVFSEDLMKKDAPGDSAMRAVVKKNKDSFVTYVWKYMLDLIYSGNGDAAWRFFDMVDWNPEWEGQLTEDGADRAMSDKEDFKQAFKEHLTTSVYWPNVKTFNNWEMLDVEM